MDNYLTYLYLTCSGQDRGSYLGIGGLAAVGAPIFGFEVAGVGSLAGATVVDGVDTAWVVETVVGGVVVDVVAAVEVVVALLDVTVVVGTLFDVVGAGRATASSEPAMMLTSAPAAGRPIPSTTVPARELITRSACWRCPGAYSTVDSETGPT